MIDIIPKTYKNDVKERGLNYMLRRRSLRKLKQRSWSFTITKKIIFRSLNVLASLNNGRKNRRSRFKVEYWNGKLRWDIRRR
jgi:hypothetical protein